MRIVWCQICTVPGRVPTLYGTLTLEFWNPAIPTGKHGESLDNIENVEKINQMSYLWFKILYSWLKTVYLSTRWLKTISFKAYITTDEKTWHMRLENMIQRVSLSLKNIKRNLNPCWHQMRTVAGHVRRAQAFWHPLKQEIVNLNVDK